MILRKSFRCPECRTPGQPAVRLCEDCKANGLLLKALHGECRFRGTDDEMAANVDRYRRMLEAGLRLFEPTPSPRGTI